MVSRDDLEACLEQLKRDVRDPRAGLYGPESMSWRIDRESILFLAGGRAILLQLAHPAVAYAIAQHSNTRSNPLGRFQRTFDNVFDMVFGDMDHAFASARRVRAIHERVRGKIGEQIGDFEEGSDYDANDADALFWVQATLIDSAIVAYEQVVRPLSLAEKEGYFAESRRFSRLFGIPDAVMPADWHAFERYTERMHNWLEVSKPALEMSEFLLHPPALGPPALARWYRLLTAGLLPARIRTAYGMPWSKRREQAFRASLVALRNTYRLVPRRLRDMPAYSDACRRLAGKPGRDPLGKLVERHLFHAVVGGS